MEDLDPTTLLHTLCTIFVSKKIQQINLGSDISQFYWRWFFFACLRPQVIIDPPPSFSVDPTNGEGDVEMEPREFLARQ